MLDCVHVHVVVRQEPCSDDDACWQLPAAAARPADERCKAGEFIAMDTQDFTCPFCLELLHEPILLPCCSANYCRGCLQQMIAGGLGSCPTCRRPMPVVDANKLPVNRLVASVIAKYLPEGACRRAAEAQSDRVAAAGDTVPQSREDCNQMSIRELKGWLRTKGVSSAHCIEKYELVELAQSFFLSGKTPVATLHTDPGGPQVGVGQSPPPPTGNQQSDPGQWSARRRAPLVFDALSEDEDEGVDWEADGAAFLDPRTVMSSAPTVRPAAATFEQEDRSRPSSVADYSATQAGDDTHEILHPSVSTIAEPCVVERAVPTAPAGTSSSSTSTFFSPIGDRPSSTYGFSNPAIPNSCATIGDGSDSEVAVEEGNQFLVEGSVKTLKEFLRAHAVAADGDWQTLIEKAELRNFALAVYERWQADMVRSATTPQCSGADSTEDNKAKGCGSCLSVLLSKLRNRGEQSEIGDE